MSQAELAQSCMRCALLCGFLIAALFLSSLPPARCQAVATWIQLNLSSSAAPSAGFCDHWTGVDEPAQRLIVTAGDNGVNNSGPQGVWAIDYAQSFETPIWVSLSVNPSSPVAPEPGGGPCGALQPSPNVSGLLFPYHVSPDPLIVVVGGHALGTDIVFNTTFYADVAPSLDSTRETYWTEDENVGEFPLVGLAWPIACWGDEAQTQLYMYGGTRADTGLDSSDLWLLDFKQPQPAWQNITGLTSGDFPRPLSGTRMQFDPRRNQLVLMVRDSSAPHSRSAQLSSAPLTSSLPLSLAAVQGGYSCTFEYNSGVGGLLCFTNAVWLLSLPPQPGYYTWTAFLDPSTGASSTWPTPRAWHSTILDGDDLWVFGGQYIDASASVYFLNDVQLFSLASLSWVAVAVKGDTPPVMWSQTANRVVSPEDGITHMVHCALPCSHSASRSSALRLSPPSALSCALLWQVVVGGCNSNEYYNSVYALKLNTAVVADNCDASGPGLISAIAGANSWFLIQTREVNVTLNSSGPSRYVYGANLSWGVQLEFDLFVIGQVGSLTTRLDSAVAELGGGLYNVSYIAFGGIADQCSGATQEAAVTISVLLDETYIPGAPFVVPITPAAFVAAKAILTDVSDVVQGKQAVLYVQPADAYGNLAQGALSVSRLSVQVDGSVPGSLSIASNDDGQYVVSYTVPSSSSFVLSVEMDGDAVTGSPFTLSPYSNEDVTRADSIVVLLFTSLTSCFVLMGCGVLWTYRAYPVFKAASPVFLLMILIGCQLTLISDFMPVASLPSSSPASCAAYSWPLSTGFTLAVASLVAKTWRIAAIFDAKRIKVRHIPDWKLGVPVLAAVLCDVLLNAIWLGADPLLPTDFVSSSNPLVHYTSCSSTHTLLWYALTFSLKGALLLYGVILASQVRNVPSAFNESRWIGLAVYNIAFCVVVVLVMLFMLNASPGSVYLIRSLVVTWCVLLTVGLLLVPKFSASLQQYSDGSSRADPAMTLSPKQHHTRQMSGGAGDSSSHNNSGGQTRRPTTASAPAVNRSYGLQRGDSGNSPVTVHSRLHSDGGRVGIPLSPTASNSGPVPSFRVAPAPQGNGGKKRDGSQEQSWVGSARRGNSNSPLEGRALTFRRTEEINPVLDVGEAARKQEAKDEPDAVVEQPADDSMPPFTPKAEDSPTALS